MDVEAPSTVSGSQLAGTSGWAILEVPSPAPVGSSQLMWHGAEMSCCHWTLPTLQNWEQIQGSFILLSSGVVCYRAKANHIVWDALLPDLYVAGSSSFWLLPMTVFPDHTIYRSLFLLTSSVHVTLSYFPYVLFIHLFICLFSLEWEALENDFVHLPRAQSSAWHRVGLQ